MDNNIGGGTLHILVDDITFIVISFICNGTGKKFVFVPLL